MNKLPVILLVVAALLIAVTQSIFVVNEQQQVIVLQFGQTQKVIEQPGINMKVPFLQNLVFLDKRVLDLAPPSQQVLFKDQRRLDVDGFARYQIEEPLKYIQTVRDESRAKARLNDIVNSAMRRVLAQYNLVDILTEKREEILAETVRTTNAEARNLGIRVLDVRIRKADLPPQTIEAVLNRMRTERQEEANRLRAEGREMAEKIKADADRQRTVLLADAQRDAQKTRGEGDNEALLTIAKATSVDPQFYGYYRTLMAYRTALKPEDTTLILQPGDGFLRQFNAVPK